MVVYFSVALRTPPSERPTSRSFSRICKRHSRDAKQNVGRKFRCVKDRQEYGGGREGGVSGWGYFEKQLCICVPKAMTVESEEEQTTFRVALVTVEAGGSGGKGAVETMSCLWSFQKVKFMCLWWNIRVQRLM